MFTGIIQQVGKIVAPPGGGPAGSLAVQTGAWTPPIALGESIAVEGVCLTVTASAGDVLRFDVLAETLAKTTLGRCPAGTAVNLERAVRAGDFLGGHIVSGHVDGVGQISRLDRRGADHVVEVHCAREILDGLVPKGSVALGGISLTVVAVRATAFTVHIVPHTWAHTSLKNARVGTAVNLETDLLGKYVRQHLATRAGHPTLTLEQVRAAGFAE
jgi:riboflavin synthase